MCPRCAWNTAHQESSHMPTFCQMRAWLVRMWKPNLPVGETDCVCSVARPFARDSGSAGCTAVCLALVASVLLRTPGWDTYLAANLAELGQEKVRLPILVLAPGMGLWAKTRCDGIDGSEGLILALAHFTAGVTEPDDLTFVSAPPCIRGQRYTLRK